MENRASDTTIPPEKRKSCLFTIPEIIPGKGRVIPNRAIGPLVFFYFFFFKFIFFYFFFFKFIFFSEKKRQKDCKKEVD